MSVIIEEYRKLEYDNMAACNELYSSCERIIFIVLQTLQACNRRSIVLVNFLK